MSGAKLFIYNLFPLLAGPVARWADHLPRIQAMGFTWIYLNPFHYTGFSGSLYAVKDYYRLDPRFQGDSPESADALLSRFTQAARDHGLSVMMDLVINHTSKDALLVGEHPEWYARREDGAIRSPGAVDPDDPTRVTEWGDLAEIDYGDRSHWPALTDYWRRLADHYVGLGFSGFRCDAAYQVPRQIWQGIIGPVKSTAPQVIFAAETLGCRPDQIEALGAAGFDWLFNSSKWWDFKGDWLLEQYDLARRIAPSIAFPESHDTPRLVSEVPPGADAEVYYRFRALFAACFSAGWMVPMGFEYGFGKQLNVVETTPDDWDAESRHPRFDLTGFLAQTNRMKADHPVLCEDGPLRLLTQTGSPVVALYKQANGGRGWTVTLANPDPVQARDVDMAELLRPTGSGVEERFQTLAPLEVRLLSGGEVTLPERGGVPKTTSQAIIIEAVWPQVDCGRFPVKREVGDVLEVTADIFKDGHDRIGAVLLYRDRHSTVWREAPMTLLDNDRWGGRFKLERNTRYYYTIEAWADAFESWRADTGKKRDAGQSITIELVEGRSLVEQAIRRATGPDRDRLMRILADCDAAAGDDDRADLLQSTMLRSLMARWPDRSQAVRFDSELEVIADRVAARFAAWYEMFPRSQGIDPGRSATFRDCEQRLPEIAELGFDVVYLVPIHPIGRTHRKGPDNSLNAGPDDPGSPYAIGGPEGGHKAVHPGLGSLDDFRHFVAECRRFDLEVALDFAIQCSPDHPYIRDHPDWFQWRPDGTIKYAENPPKKYQDIVNVNFYGPHAPALWAEMLDVVLFWVDNGVKIFRVDNPHTKPVPFWEWLIRNVQDKHPDVLFLSEAFTRPKMMRMLAKIGFSQSYTYFTWRNFKAELTDYLDELAQGEARDYFRPNFFPTTPDILPPYLQTGGRPAFRIRLVLAATLSSVYGIYNGYELCENAAVPGKEEYLHSEKYQYKVWDWRRPGHIKDDIAKINAIRRANPALHEYENLRFHPAGDDNVLFYGKMTLDRGNMIFVAVNLDPFDAHEAVLTFPLAEMGVPGGETFEVEELLTGQKHLWRGADHAIRLDPSVNPAVIYRITVWTSVDYRTPCF